MSKSPSREGRLPVHARIVDGKGKGVLGVPLPSGSVVALIATLVLLAAAPAALATPSRSLESSFGSFEDPQSITVDQSTGDVYVLDIAAGTVSRFTAAGAPAEFSATKTNVLSGFIFEANAGQVAVAPAGSPGGTEGDIYVVSSITDNVSIYDPNGNHVGELTGSGDANAGFSEACGVATEASTGAVYVAEYGGHVWRYTPTSGTVSEADYTGGIATAIEVCSVAADAGSVYGGNTYSGSELRKYQASAFVTGTPPAASSTLVDASATSVATDPANGDVYVDEGSKISVFDASGASLYTFGSSSDFGSNSWGVGVKAANGNAYVADAHAGGLQVDVYGPAVNPSVATTNPASAIHHTDVVLNGHLDPGGDPSIVDCHFDWGTDTKYEGGTVPCNEGNTFNAPADVTGNLDNLTPNVTIHYRLDITGSVSGTLTGADQTVTPPVFPTSHDQIAAFGEDGTSATTFFFLPKLAFDQVHRRLYAVSNGRNAIYGFDASAPPAYPTLSGFSPLALGSEPINGNPGLAVDGATGNLYLVKEGAPVSQGAVFGFGDGGVALGGNFPVDPAVTPGAPSGSPKHICGAAVDSTGDLWVANAETKQILRYNSAGVFQSALDVSAQGSPCDLAFDSNDDLYVRQTGVWRYTAASGYTTAIQIAPNGENKSITVDPANHHLYITLNKEVDEYDASGTLLGRFATGLNNRGFNGIAVDGTNHDVYVAEGESPAHILVFGPGFVVEAPTVTTQNPTGVSGSTATLHALVDPEKFNITDCHFDYGTTAAYGQSIPCSPSPGSGSGDVAVSANLTALNAGTTYRYRIVAANANPDGTTSGADQTLTTAGPRLADTSAGQITTTEARLSAQINPEGKPTTYRFDYGATSAYGSTTAEESTIGADSSDQPAVKAISGLTPGTTYHFRIVATNVDGINDGPDATFTTPALTGALGLPDDRVFELLTPDTGDIQVYEPIVDNAEYSSIETEWPFQASQDGTEMAYMASPSEGGNEQAGEHGGNQYLARRTGSGEWMQTNLSPVGFPSAVFQGFSSDLAVGFLDALEPMAPAAPGFGEEILANNYDVLYKTSTSSEQGYAPLITAVPPYRSKGSFASYGLHHPVFPNTRSETRVLGYAGASADSSHVLFEANDALTPEAQGGSATHYAEENNLYESVNGQLRLVNVLPNGSTQANATFGAPPAQPELSPDYSHVISNDGARIFWTDLNTGHIYVRENGTSTTEISSEGRYWTATPDGSKVFYTNGDLYEYETNSGHTTDLTPGVTVQGVIGTSEDGDYVYYVTAGFDLDLWHSGATSTVKTLAAGDNKALSPFGLHDAGDWQPGEANRMAEVSPDGRGLVFMSAEGAEGVGKVDVYDAASGQVYCASCGSRGSHGFLPLTFSNTYLKRWISTDGSRVFFDSFEGLVPQDTNGRLDVYEWERDGAGACKVLTGCVYLLSGGTSKAESYFADASASGNDVFIVTRAKLLSKDQDQLYDLYDARVGGAEPVAAPQCTGAGCQGVAGAPPIFATPSSVTFAGVGNFAAPAPVVKAKPKPKKRAKPKPKKKAKRKPKPKHHGRGKAKKGAKANGKAGTHRQPNGKGGRP